MIKQKKNMLALALVLVFVSQSVNAGIPESAGTASEVSPQLDSEFESSSQQGPIVMAVLPTIAARFAAGAGTVAVATKATAAATNAVADLTEAAAESVDAVADLVDAVAETFSFGGGENMSLIGEALEIRKEMLLDDLG